MKFKKILPLMLSLALLLPTLAGCQNTPAPQPNGSESSENASQTPEPEQPRTAIRIASLKGPTSMGLVKLMEDSENGQTSGDYHFQIVTAADEITPKLLKGELDMAAIPVNLASVLYNRSEGEICMLAVNTPGVLYIVEKGDSVQNVADLRGKTIYATGKGQTPEYALRYILTANGLNPDQDVTIEWKSESTEIVSLLAHAENGIAMLPQPFVTVAAGQVSDLRVALDLTKEWEATGQGGQMLTGSLVVRKSFAQENPQAVAAFLKEYAASTTFAKEQVTEAAKLIEKYGIVKAAVAEKALPFCNITLITGSDLQAPVSGYLSTLLAQNPASIGGKLPGDDFYYIHES